MVQNENFPVKNGLLSANSRFGVLNHGTYLPRITRETYITEHRNLDSILAIEKNNYFSATFHLFQFKLVQIPDNHSTWC